MAISKITFDELVQLIDQGLADGKLEQNSCQF